MLLGQVGRFDAAVGSEDHLRVVVVDDLVELPEIDHVGLESAEAVFEVLHGRLLVAAVVLGHQEGLVAVAILEGLAHDLFGSSVVVFPGVVQERDTHVDGLAGQADADALVAVTADVVAAQAEDRDVGRRCRPRGVWGCRWPKTSRPRPVWPGPRRISRRWWFEETLAW